MKWLKLHRHWLMGWAWIILAIPGITIWKESILFVIMCSLYANIESAFAAHEAQKAQDE